MSGDRALIRDHTDLLPLAFVTPYIASVVSQVPVDYSRPPSKHRRSGQSRQLGVLYKTLL